MPRPARRALAPLAAFALLVLLVPTPARASHRRDSPGPTDQRASSAPTLDHRFGIAEGFRNPAVMARIGAGWERVVLSWSQIQPDGPGDFGLLGRTLPGDALDGELRRGVRVAGLLQFTPAWAQSVPEHGERSVPLNLDLPFDHPENYWGQFVYHTVRSYAGRIDEWIIWNEPEFRPEDAGAGGSFTWLGTDAEFAQLLRVGYLAARKANPRATVSFPGTSYWVEELAAPRRAQFYERILHILADDPEAEAHSSYHDAVSLNLYRTPDDLVRVHELFKSIQAAYGLDKPIWLLELNAMPSDDAAIPCADLHAATPFQTTMDEQAAYALQALALAAAAGYQRIGFYQMVDDDPCAQPAVWGVTRDDGSPRPVAEVLDTATTYLSGFTGARFAPLSRARPAWSAWPEDPGSYTPNWQAYLVAFDLPGRRRVTVLWNGDGAPLRVRVPRHSPSARLVDRRGEALALQPSPGGWVVDLPAATARFPLDPPGYHFIGGDPLLLVEEGVEPAAPVEPPQLVEAVSR